jgi:carbon storage regulator CsrA
MDDYGSLVITRMENEAVWIGDQIRISVGSVVGKKVQLHITAPKSLNIAREELLKGNE